jgi:hypothetical protein
MNPRRQPDPVARFLSHAIVGAAAGWVVGQKSGPGTAILAALAAVAAHEEFDAPLADVLTELGI